MSGRVLAKRYAKAILSALKEEEVEMVREGLDTFQQILEISPEMRKVLLSPVFGIDEKKGVLQLLSQKVGFSKESERFFELILEKDRLRYLKEIRAVFESLLYERRNKVKAHVISSNSFSPSYETELRERLKRLTKKDVDLEIETDPDLIAGLVVRIGDVVYDGSIKGQLNRIKEELLK